MREDWYERIAQERRANELPPATGQAVSILPAISRLAIYLYRYSKDWAEVFGCAMTDILHTF